MGISLVNGRWEITADSGGDSPVISWNTIDLSQGTVYGNSAIVTSRTATSLTIDPGENAAAFLDNSPDNRGDYWWATQAVDLSDWPASSPALLMAEIIRGDSAPSHGTMIGIMFHNAADPTSATKYSGVWIRRKTNGDADAWNINNWGNLGGFFSTFANRQRISQIMWANASRNEILDWVAWYTKKDGDSGNDRSSDLTTSAPQAFDITGGLWVSVIAGAYQPNSPADSPSAHTPIAVRYAISPFGTNPS